jgi:hypothetical protein
VGSMERKASRKEYAVYKGDEFICLGTINECAKFLGINPKSVRHLMTPSYIRRVEKRKNNGDFLVMFRLDDEKEDT